MSTGDAAEVADILNTVCGATVEALRQDNDVRRAGLRRQLARLTRDLEGEAPALTEFLGILEAWLAGRPPAGEDIAAIDNPYRRVLRQMLQQVGATEPAEADAGATPPLRESTLAQLVAAVVTATKHDDDPRPARRLAAQLINVEQQLSGPHHNDAVTFFENLRAVLGGADPATLPTVEAEPYGPLWETVQYLLSVEEDFEDTTREALMQRLVHNAVFVQKAGDDELRQALAHALLDVQRQAIGSGEEQLSALVAATRAHLLGLDPTPHSSLLDGEELAAWRKIQRAPGKSSAS